MRYPTAAEKMLKEKLEEVRAENKLLKAELNGSHYSMEWETWLREKPITPKGG